MVTRFLWLVLACLAPVEGAVVYSSQGPTADAVVDLTLKTAGTLFNVSDPSIQVAAVRIWIMGVDADPTTSFSGDLIYAFYTNNLGALGTLAGQGALTGLVADPTFMPANNSVGGVYGISFDLNAPLVLTQGSYFLVLHEGTSLSTYDSSEIRWMATAPGYSIEGNLGSLPGATATNQQAAFELFDTPFGTTAPPPTTGAPEPATFGLLGLTILAGTAIRRMRCVQ